MPQLDVETTEPPARASGFSLVELVIVVAVITVIAAIALPFFAGGRKTANETSAIASLRTISNAQLQYRTRFGAYGDLPELASVSLVDSTFDDAERTGYRFSSASISGSTWAILAEPVDPGISGDRHFFIDQSGVIRFREGAAADASADPVD